MTTRQQLHELIDDLPESEIGPVAELIVSRGDDPVLRAFEEAPLDDEPWTEDDEAAIAEVQADRAAGMPDIPLEQVMRDLGDA